MPVQYFIARYHRSGAAMRAGDDGIYRRVEHGGEDPEFGRLGPIDPPPTGYAESHYRWVAALAQRAGEIDPDHHSYFVVRVEVQAVWVTWEQAPLF